MASGRKIQLLLILFPGLLIFLLFTIYPIAKMFLMSFFDWHIGPGQLSDFIGLKNYVEVFTNKTGLRAIRNTFFYTLVTVPGQIVIGLFIAVLITGLRKGQLIYRLAYYLPVITSWVIVSILYKYIFNNEGFLNYLLTEIFPITEQYIKWLERASSAMFVIEILGIWKGLGWNMVIFIAALSTVPVELYEVADMDGCGSAKKFLYISLPSIKGTFLFAVVMLTIGAFNVFTSIKLLTDGAPLHRTEVVLTWMYKNAFEYRDFGYAAALSYIVALIIAGLAYIQFKYIRREKA